MNSPGGMHRAEFTRKQEIYVDIVVLGGIYKHLGRMY